MRSIIVSVFIFVLSGWAGRAQSVDALKQEATDAEAKELYAEAAALFENAFVLSKAQDLLDSVSLFKAGENYLKAEQFAKALPLLSNAVVLKYNVGPAARLLADTYYGLKQPGKAEEILLSIKDSIKTEAAEFDEKMAFLYFNTKQYEKAASCFRVVCDSMPAKSNYLYLYGVSLLRAKAYNEAIVVSQSLMEKFPGDSRSRKLLGMSMLEKANAESLAMLQPLVVDTLVSEKDSIDPFVRKDKIRRDYETARVILEQSLLEFPMDQQIINSLYRVYTFQENSDRAEKMRKRMR